VSTRLSRVGSSDEPDPAVRRRRRTSERRSSTGRSKRLRAGPLETWFHDGLDTKGLSLIKVHVDSREVLGVIVEKVPLIGAAWAAATGDPDKFPGTNPSVDL
jgi:hypothetical protein